MFGRQGHFITPFKLLRRTKAKVVSFSVVVIFIHKDKMLSFKTILPTILEFQLISNVFMKPLSPHLAF